MNRERLLRAKQTEDERHADFLAVADKRYVAFVESGETVSWNDMRAYLEKRIAGKPARRPVARKLAR
jgi:hypothetical protein